MAAASYLGADMRVVTSGKKSGFHCSSIRYNMPSWFWCGERVFLCLLKEQSPAAQCVVIPAVIYCLGISSPGFRWESLLRCHNFITIYPLVLLIKWQGSHKAAERGGCFISEVNQTGLCLLPSPTLLPVCLPTCLSACMSRNFLACVLVCQVVCLSVAQCTDTRKVPWYLAVKNDSIPRFMGIGTLRSTVFFTVIEQCSTVATLFLLLGCKTMHKLLWASQPMKRHLLQSHW